MNTKEAVKVTGVSARNIRFYEQKGLLTPNRNKDNDYREYSQEDIDRLMLIRALRMVDISLEQIKLIVDGELSVQEAVAQQKKDLKKKIRKIKIAIDFCDELEKVDSLGVKEVLARMDQPENKKLLSDKWKTDFAEVAKKVGTTLLIGVIIFFLGGVPLYPLLILSVGPQGYMLLGALALIALWYFVGYKLYDKTWWWLHLLLAHLYPAVCLYLALFQNGINNIPSAVVPFGAYYLLKTILWQEEMLPLDCIWAFLLMLAVFGIGMLLGWRAKNRKNAKKEKKSSKIRLAYAAFSERHSVLGNLIAGVVIAVLCCILCLLLILPASVDYLGPMPISEVKSRMAGDVRADGILEVECYGYSYRSEVPDPEGFLEMLDIDEWERRYICFLEPHKIARIGFITVYSNDMVSMSTGSSWFPRTIYFEIPEGKSQQIVDYLIENGLV